MLFRVVSHIPTCLRLLDWIDWVITMCSCSVSVSFMARGISRLSIGWLHRSLRRITHTRTHQSHHIRQQQLDGVTTGSTRPPVYIDSSRNDSNHVSGKHPSPPAPTTQQITSASLDHTASTHPHDDRQQPCHVDTHIYVRAPHATRPYTAHAR